MTVNIYKAYLAVDTVQKRLESVGLAMGSATIAKPLAESLGENDRGVPYSMLYPVIRVEAQGFGITYSETEEERQQIREEALLGFVRAFPDAKVLRDGSQSHIYFQMFDGIGVRIAFGTAMCKKVQVGTRISYRPAPDAPMIQYEEPVYEYRCNDAELAVL